MAERPLAGCGVVVTRPAHQAEPLCRALEAAGATVLRFPTLQIAPLTVPALDGAYDWILYSSSNAVAHAGALRRLRGQVAAIGPATAAALAAAGIAAEVVATGAGSEPLLEAMAPRLAAGQRALLITGRDGRGLLPPALRARGVRLEVVEVYERVATDLDPAALEDAWRRGASHAITITSNATLENLHRMLTPQGRERLRDAQLVVASARAVRLARELGIRPDPLVAEGADSAALVTALTSWWAQTGPRSNHGR